MLCRFDLDAGGAGILHFATHGTLNNASPMYSYLVLARGDSNEDGLLEAWELMQMDLKANLAILSACDTARGRFGSGLEHLYGCLRRLALVEPARDSGAAFDLEEIVESAAASGPADIR